MDLYACGLNDCGQITLHESDQRANEHEFNKIASAESISILFAGSNETLALIDGIAHIMGHRGPKQLDPSHPLSKLPPSAQCFGDDSVGILGSLDTTGVLTLMTPVPKLSHLSPSLECPETLAVPISHMAIDGHGRVTVVLLETDSTVQNIEEPRMTVLEFPSFYATPTSAAGECFSDWIARVQTSYAVEKSDIPTSQPPMHSLPGICAQLVANEDTFLLRTQSGYVYAWSHINAWGVARDFFYCLKPDGTRVSEEEFDRLAAIPCLTDFEDRYNAAKISSRGLLSIAVITARDPRFLRGRFPTQGIIWGLNVFGKDPIPEVGHWNGLLDDFADKQDVFSEIDLYLNENGDIDDTGVDFDPSTYAEFGVEDVCAGHGHVLLTDDKGQVWSTGRNQHGQLGRAVPNAEAGCDVSWARVSGLEDVYANQAKVIALYCGRTTSFVLIRKNT